MMRQVHLPVLILFAVCVPSFGQLTVSSLLPVAPADPAIAQAIGQISPGQRSC